MAAPAHAAYPVVLVLAAGAGRRYKSSGGTTHKLDALIDGMPVLQHVLQAVRLSGLAFHVVQPESHLRGMADSIASGVRATANAAGWLILPGDLPLIQSATLQAVATAMMTGTASVVVPHYGSQQGHPVGFKSNCYTGLAALFGDGGAAPVLRQQRDAGQVHELPLHDVGIVTDIDTVDDLEWARALQRTQWRAATALPKLQ